MTDEQFVLKETNKERAAMKNGAYHKKSGSKSKSCKLPSDYLSTKEKQALNGPVSSWRLDHFYSLDEFKAMPKDIQEAYLTAISGKYRVGLSAIGRDLFGHKTLTTLFKYVKNNDLKPTIVKTAGTGAKNAADAFRKVIADERNKKDKIEIPEMETSKPETGIQEEIELPENEPAKPETEIQKVPIMDACITSRGFDSKVFHYLEDLFSGQNDILVTITVYKE